MVIGVVVVTKTEANTGQHTSQSDDNIIVSVCNWNMIDKLLFESFI